MPLVPLVPLVPLEPLVPGPLVPLVPLAPLVPLVPLLPPGFVAGPLDPPLAELVLVPGAVSLVAPGAGEVAVPDDGADADGQGAGAGATTPSPLVLPPVDDDELDDVASVLAFQEQPRTSTQRLFELRDEHDGG